MFGLIAIGFRQSDASRRSGSRRTVAGLFCRSLRTAHLGSRMSYLDTHQEWLQSASSMA